MAVVLRLPRLWYGNHEDISKVKKYCSLSRSESAWQAAEYDQKNDESVIRGTNSRTLDLHTFAQKIHKQMEM